MNKDDFNGDTVKCKSQEIIKKMLLISVILVSLFIIRIFWVNENLDYLNITLNFVKLINELLAIISVISCFILYNKTKDSIVFTLLLMYLGLTVGIIMGQIDYLTFLYEKFTLSNYIAISTSILRIAILYITLFPKSKIYLLINRYKGYSIVFVVLYSIIFGFIENRLEIKEVYLESKIFVLYNIFLFISYTIVALNLVKTSIKESKAILMFFGTSIFLLAIKAMYAIYGWSYISFNIKLTSVLITYVCFFIIIIGTGIEVYLVSEESKYLSEEVKKFFSLVDNNSHAFMFICDNNLNISYMNNKIKEYHKGNIDNDKYKKILLNNKDVKNKLHDIMESLERDKTWRGIIKDVEANEVYDSSIQLIHSESGKNEILVSFIDISKHLKLEAEIETRKLNDIKKGEFLSTLSHELKTPLNIFYSTVQLLDNFKENNTTEFIKMYSKYSNSLKLNCKRMLRLVNNIVDTTRIDIGAFIPEFRNYDIVAITEDITLSTVPFAKSKDIRIEFDTNMEEHYIKCDSQMIEKILLNLLSNAIKYSPNGKYIFVNVHIEEKRVKIIVKDQGIGIREELKEKIFDRFMRGDESLRRLNEGSGIGLSVVKSMIEMHDGKIFIESIVGEGSKFEVHLPNIIIEDSPKIQFQFNTANTELELSDIY